MRAVILYILLLSGVAYGAPTIKSDPVPGAEWFVIEIDDEEFCCVKATDDMLLADFGFLTVGQHDVSISACNLDSGDEGQCGAPVHFFIDVWPDNKMWTYWRILPSGGYEQYFVDPLGAHVNIKTGNMRLDYDGLRKMPPRNQNRLQRRIHMGLHQVPR